MSIFREATSRYVLRHIKASISAGNKTLDRLAAIAAGIFDVPCAAISLTDTENQYFAAAIGLPVTSIPRDSAPCDETARCRTPIVHRDLAAHPTYRNSPATEAGLRFYAGVPLITTEGIAIGALSVLAPKPRRTTPREILMLTEVAAVVMAQIEQTLTQIHIDPISGLPNRGRFDEELSDMAEHCPGQPLIAAVIDLGAAEQISAILRVMGPSYLEEMIADLGRFVRGTVDPLRPVFHVSATQFATLAPIGMSLEDYAALARSRLADSEQMQTQFGGGVALGIAPFILGETGAEGVLRMANSAVQDARLHHQSLRTYSERHDEAHRRRFELVQSFEAALKQPGELSLYVQPRIDLRHGTCRTAEALLRWNHPRLGAVSPAEFIPLIEATAMIHGLTDWVVTQALDQVAGWRSTRPDFVVSVNVSPSNLSDETFASRLLRALEARDLPSSAIELEVTETTFLRKDAVIMRTLAHLSDAGVPLAIDDFGTGYSSLSYLQALPAQTVKLDRSFMQELESDQRKHALVATTTMLCKTLGYRVVAEGLETSESVEAVIAMGCDEGQGYHFARPIPATALAGWLTDMAAQSKETIATA